MNKNKSISVFLCGVLFLSACAQSPNESGGVAEVQKTSAPSRAETDFYNFWSNIGASAQPHLGLATLLRPYVFEGTRKEKSANITLKSSFISDFEKERSAMKRKFLLGRVPFSEDHDILNGTLIYSENSKAFSSEGFVQEFDLALQVQIQNRAMTSLMDSYKNRAQDVARELAPFILKEVSAEDLETLNTVSGNREQQIQKIVEVLKKYDKVLSAYEFHPEDNVKLVLLGTVAVVLADELAKNKSLQHFLVVARDVQKTAKLVQEVAALIQVVEDNRSQMKRDWEKMRLGMDGLVHDLNQIKKGLNPKTRSEGMRLIEDALNGRLKEGSGGSFLTQRQSISKNVELFVSSAAAASDGLNNILNATETISLKLGIRLDPGVRDALNTARQVTAAVSLAKNMMAAYATGGLVGALGVFGGGGGAAAILGGAQDAMAADLKEIKRELQEIKRLQVQMIEMQVETMKMIRDLAIMLESYHREEMYLLKELKGLQLMQYETTMIETHWQIRACEDMLRFAVLGNKSFDGDLFSIGTINVINLSRDIIYAPLKDKEKLKEFIQSMGEGTLSFCQMGLNRAFANASAKENPVQLIASGKTDLLSLFYQEKYIPLLEKLKSLESSRDLSAMALHMPASNVLTLQKKGLYTKGRVAGISSDQLRYLISAEGLERYVEALLLLNPVVSFDKDAWKEFLKDKASLKGNYDLAWNRSSVWLKNALALTQTAISQEALLAGEPLLDSLYGDLGEIINSKDDCRAPSNSLVCAVKTNPMLRDNLLMYYLHVSSSFKPFMARYRTAYEKQDISQFKGFFGEPLDGNLAVQEVNGQKRVVLKWGGSDDRLISVLPSIEEIWAGSLKYSENMSRLLILQEKVVNALLEVTPMYIDEATREDLIKALLVK